MSQKIDENTAKLDKVLNAYENIQNEYEKVKSDMESVSEKCKKLEAENFNLRKTKGRLEALLSDKNNDNNSDNNDVYNEPDYKTVTHKRPKKRHNDSDLSQQNTQKRQFVKSTNKTNNETNKNNFTRDKVHTILNKESYPPLPSTDDAEMASNSEQQTENNFPQPSDSDNSEKLPKKIRIPPIVLRQKELYNDLSIFFKNKGVNYGSAVTVPEGVKLHPSTPDDYRFIANHLETNNISFYSFSFPEEKLLHVVLRGVLENWGCEKIKNDLNSLGFTPNNVIRWYRRDSTPMPLVLITLPKNQKGIF